jgi:hypothetical protein
VYDWKEDLIMKLKRVKDKLTEGNHYVHATDEGIQELFGNRMNRMKLWRLVLGRPHGEPVFEPLEEFNCPSEAICEEEVEAYVKDNKLTWLEFEEDDFLEVTGTALGHACFDG